MLGNLKCHYCKTIMEFCGAFQNRFFLFFCACLSGILFALVWRKYEQTVQFSLVHNHYASALRESNYNEWLQKQNMSKQLVAEELFRYSESKDRINSESQYLYNKTQVLCLVLVNSHKGAEAVKQTWAKHCNIAVYFGRFVDEKIPVIKIPHVTSFEGFCYAFVHMYYKYSGQYKWILIADDYTYASIENLRYYVAPLNESFPYYLGHPVKDYSHLYNVGSAGILLSHSSAMIIHSEYKNFDDCVSKSPPSWYYDQSIGRILRSFNVHPVDTRDTYLRGRFNPFSVETMLIPGSISIFSSYWRSSAFLVEEGMNCCSDRAITFHGLLPPKMYLMEYILYHLAVFRHSFKGLGNKEPKEMENYESSKMKRKEKYKVGEPFIQLLDKDWIKSKKLANSKNANHNAAENIWDEIFGPS